MYLRFFFLNGLLLVCFMQFSLAQNKPTVEKKSIKVNDKEMVFWQDIDSIYQEIEPIFIDTAICQEYFFKITADSAGNLFFLNQNPTPNVLSVFDGYNWDKIPVEKGIEPVGVRIENGKVIVSLEPLDSNKNNHGEYSDYNIEYTGNSFALKKYDKSSIYKSANYTIRYREGYSRDSSSGYRDFIKKIGSKDSVVLILDWATPYWEMPNGSVFFYNEYQPWMQEKERDLMLFSNGKKITFEKSFWKAYVAVLNDYLIYVNDYSHGGIGMTNGTEEKFIKFPYPRPNGSYYPPTSIQYGPTGEVLVIGFFEVPFKGTLQKIYHFTGSEFIELASKNDHLRYVGGKNSLYSFIIEEIRQNCWLTNSHFLTISAVRNKWRKLKFWGKAIPIDLHSSKVSASSESIPHIGYDNYYDHKIYLGDNGLLGLYQRGIGKLSEPVFTDIRIIETPKNILTESYEEFSNFTEYCYQMRQVNGEILYVKIGSFKESNGRSYPDGMLPGVIRFTTGVCKHCNGTGHIAASTREIYEPGEWVEEKKFTTTTTERENKYDAFKGKNTEVTTVRTNTVTDGGYRKKGRSRIEIIPERKCPSCDGMPIDNIPQIYRYNKNTGLYQ